MTTPEPSQGEQTAPRDQDVATLGQIIELVEQRYPPQLAESWDAVGLVCGDRESPVRRVHCALDPTLDVIDEAIEAGADLLITHHPLLLRGVHSVATDHFKGAAIHRLIRANCALYVAHTNADNADPGVSDALARIVGLDCLRPLVPQNSGSALHKIVTFVPTDAAEAVIDALSSAGAGKLGDYSRCAWTSQGIGTFIPESGAQPAIGEHGAQSTVPETRIEMVFHPPQLTAVLRELRQAHPYEEPAFDVFATVALPTKRGLGRVGELAEPMTLNAFANVVAKALPYTVQGVRVAGDADAMVHRIAVCGGSGDSFFDAVRRSGADAYLTSDLRHHPASEAREAAGQNPPYLIDVAHWAGEWPWLHYLGSWLSTDAHHHGYAVECHISTLRSDPWSFRVPSSGGFVR